MLTTNICCPAVLPSNTQMKVTIPSRKHASETMKGVEWFGKQDMRVVDRPRPMVTDPRDVSACPLRHSGALRQYKQTPLAPAQLMKPTAAGQ